MPGKSKNLLREQFGVDNAEMKNVERAEKEFPQEVLEHLTRIGLSSR